MARWLKRFILLTLVMMPGGWERARAQLNWRSFNYQSDGLAASYPTYLSFSPRGKLWVRHRDDATITELDGYEAHAVPGPQFTGTSPMAFRVYESVTGQLWTLHPDGVQWRDGDHWRLAVIPDVRAEMRNQINRVARPIPLLPAEHNKLLILLSDRLAKFDAATEQVHVLREAESVGLGRFSDLVAAVEGGLWVTAENGIARVSSPKRRLDLISTNSPWIPYPLPAALEARNPTRPIEDGEGGLFMLAEDTTGERRKWLHFLDGAWTIEPLGHGLKAAWMTSDGKAWGLEITSLHQWLPPDLDARNMDDIGIQPAGFSDIAVEPGGAFWISTPDGVWRYAPSIWSPPRHAPPVNGEIHDIRQANDGTLWFLGPNCALRLKSGQWNQYPLQNARGATNASTSPLGELADGRIFFSADDGLQIFDPASNRFRPVPSPDGLPVRYLGGSSNRQYFAEADARNAGEKLIEYDGVHWRPPDCGQPAKEIGAWTTLMIATNGVLWLGGLNGAASHLEGRWRTFTVDERQIPAGVNSFLDLGGGTIWAAARDRVLSLAGEEWSDLKTGLDHVNGLSMSTNGTVWIASASGLFRLYQNQWIALGAEEGVPNGAQIVRESADGHLWLGHERGVSLFHPEVDHDPPHTMLENTPPAELLKGNDVISFVYAGRDKWKATPPERLLYSYRIDDQPWIPAPTTRISFPASNLSAGAHRFEVRAMDRMLNVDPVPAFWAFTVRVPWYRETRMVSIVALAAAAVAVFAGLAVNRHLRLMRSYAEVERIVQERTRQLEVANRELAHAEKMRSLGTLAAGVAHDFNSILSIIRGSVQIIEAHPENAEKVQTRISRIKSMVEQGSTLVKAMLGFSRADDAKLVIDDVGTVVSDTVRLLGDRLPAEVEVTLDITPRLPPVHGTRELLQQMLVNLMLNAVDAMEGRGHLTVRCQRLHQVPEHWVLAPAPSSAYVRVAVEDTGCGISPENLSRVFEPFFTTKAFSTRHGTGLGLSMVYEFSKELGYGLNVRSELGRGTAFQIVIPVLEKAGTGGAGQPAG